MKTPSRKSDLHRTGSSLGVKTKPVLSRSNTKTSKARHSGINLPSVESPNQHKITSRNPLVNTPKRGTSIYSETQSELKSVNLPVEQQSETKSTTHLQFAPSSSNLNNRNNVRVYVRFRPVNEVEEGLLKNNVGWLVPEYNNEKVVTIDAHRSSMNPHFAVDHVFSSETMQESVYSTVGKEIINDILNGYNGTIFAYGQSGSGKTFTMYGTDINKGIIPRIVDEIFNYVESTNGDIEFELKLSVFQIYKEVIYDLLNGEKDLKIKENPVKGIYVDGLSEVYLTTIDDFLSYSELAQNNRIVSETGLNQSSSRSHMIMMLEVTQTFIKENLIKKGILNLVDLAGSEKISKTGAVGETLEEAKKINLSLSALGNVIHALTSGSEHIPYRDSKLTRILQESLGGNYKTSLIITCSPHSYHLEETISSLQFAQRAKTIKNKVKVNIKLSYEELQKMIEKLKIKLQKAHEVIRKLKSGNVASDSEIDDEEEKKVEEIKKEEEKDHQDHTSESVIIRKLDESICPNCELLKEKQNVLEEKLNSMLNEVKERDSKIAKLKEEISRLKASTGDIPEAKTSTPLNIKSDAPQSTNILSSFSNSLINNQQNSANKNEDLYKYLKNELDSLKKDNRSLNYNEELEQNNIDLLATKLDGIINKNFGETIIDKTLTKGTIKYGQIFELIDQLIVFNEKDDETLFQNEYKEKLNSLLLQFENQHSYSSNEVLMISFILKYINFYFSYRLILQSKSKLTKDNKYLAESNSILISIIDDVLTNNFELNQNINTKTNQFNLLRSSIIESGTPKEVSASNDDQRISFAEQASRAKISARISTKNLKIINQLNKKALALDSGFPVPAPIPAPRRASVTFGANNFLSMLPLTGEALNNKNNIEKGKKKQSKLSMIKDILVTNIKETERLKNNIEKIRKEFGNIIELNEEYFTSLLGNGSVDMSGSNILISSDGKENKIKNKCPSKSSLKKNKRDFPFSNSAKTDKSAEYERQTKKSQDKSIESTENKNEVEKSSNKERSIAKISNISNEKSRNINQGDNGLTQSKSQHIVSFAQQVFPLNKSQSSLQKSIKTHDENKDNHYLINITENENENENEIINASNINQENIEKKLEINSFKQISITDINNQEEKEKKFEKNKISNSTRDPEHKRAKEKKKSSKSDFKNIQEKIGTDNHKKKSNKTSKSNSSQNIKENDKKSNHDLVADKNINKNIAYNLEKKHSNHHNNKDSRGDDKESKKEKSENCYQKNVLKNNSRSSSKSKSNSNSRSNSRSSSKSKSNSNSKSNSKSNSRSSSKSKSNSNSRSSSKSKSKSESKTNSKDISKNDNFNIFNKPTCLPTGNRNEVNNLIEPSNIQNNPLLINHYGLSKLAITSQTRRKSILQAVNDLNQINLNSQDSSKKMMKSKVSEPQKAQTSRNYPNQILSMTIEKSKRNNPNERIAMSEYQMSTPRHKRNSSDYPAHFGLTEEKKDRNIEYFVSKYLETGTATRKFDGIRVRLLNNVLRCEYETGLNAEHTIVKAPINPHILQNLGDNDSFVNVSEMSDAKK